MQINSNTSAIHIEQFQYKKELIIYVYSYLK